MKVYHQSLQFSSSSPQFAYSWLCNDLSSPNFYIVGFLETVPFVEKSQISTKLSQPKFFLFSVPCRFILNGQYLGVFSPPSL